VNVTLEHLAPCKKLMRVEVDAATVDAAFEEITREFMRLARLPGFRPGKAPRHLVAQSFGTEIETEVKRKLISENFRKALEEQKLQVIGRPDVEEIQFAKGQALQFAATVETAPEFELPDYQGIKVKREVRAVTEEDVVRAIDMLREQRATYLDVQRPVQAGDFVVVNYVGTCEGQPIVSIAPASRGLSEKKDFWVRVAEGSFIPGFTEQLIGAQEGEKRTVNVQFPADFVAPQLAGKPGVYEVEVVKVKEKLLPEANDEFAKSFGAETIGALQAGVRNDLEAELHYKTKRSTRDQLVRELLTRVTCDLPESAVASETRNRVYDIVRQNQERGVPRELIDQQKDQIFSVANNSARDRVKADFILRKIGEKENVAVSNEEISRRIVMLAQQADVKPEKMVRQLQEQGAIGDIRDEILVEKVLDLLEKQAEFDDALPPGGTPV
jgi:trigger factor